MSDDTTTATTPLTPTAASEASESTRAAAEWLRLLITDFRRHNSFSGRATVRYATTALAAIERVSELEEELVAARMTNEESGALLNEVTAALARHHQEPLSPCPCCEGHLGAKAIAAINQALKWQSKQLEARAAAEQRTRDAEAREGRLREALRDVRVRDADDGLPCWCRHELLSGLIHTNGCWSAREALAVTTPAPAASEPATATPASGGGEATASSEGRSTK